MKVLLVSANTESISMPVIPSGLACVAAAASTAGHHVELLDLRTAAEPRDALRVALERFCPEVIGVSVRNIDDQNGRNPRFLLAQVKEVIAGCRRYSRAPVVLGGAGYSIFPGSVLDYLGADIGVQGEGERAFPAVLQSIGRGADPGSVPGVYLAGKAPTFEAQRQRDLDALPFPDVSLWQDAAGREDVWLPLQTRRGCPLGCIYCSTPAIEGTTLRRRNPRAVAEAVQRYAGIGFRRVYFTDNTFNLPPSYALDLCRALSASSPGISWRCILYPARVDEALVREMARANCSEVSIGFESGSERMLRTLRKRFNPEDVRRTSKLLADYGVRRTGFLLLGGPGETMESVRASLAFADSLGLEAGKVSVGIRIYPRTPLAATAVEEGILEPNDDLLLPRFYLARGLEDALPQAVAEWVAARPSWMT